MPIDPTIVLRGVQPPPDIIQQYGKMMQLKDMADAGKMRQQQIKMNDQTMQEHDLQGRSEKAVMQAMQEVAPNNGEDPNVFHDRLIKRAGELGATPKDVLSLQNMYLDRKVKLQQIDNAGLEQNRARDAKLAAGFATLLQVPEKDVEQYNQTWQALASGWEKGGLMPEGASTMPPPSRVEARVLANQAMGGEAVWNKELNDRRVKMEEERLGMQKDEAGRAKEEWGIHKRGILADVAIKEQLAKLTPEQRANLDITEPILMWKASQGDQSAIRTLENIIKVKSVEAESTAKAKAGAEAAGLFVGGGETPPVTLSTPGGQVTLNTGGAGQGQPQSQLPVTAVAPNLAPDSSSTIKVSTALPANVKGMEIDIGKENPTTGIVTTKDGITVNLGSRRHNFNESALEGLNPGVATLIKFMAEGRIPPPSSFAIARSPQYWNTILGVLAQYDPSYNAQAYGNISSTWRAFTSGREAKSANALNTFFHHLDHLDSLVDTLDNSRFPLVNKIINPMATAVGSTKVTDFDTVVPQVIKEIITAWKGAGGNQSDTDELREVMHSSAGYPQMKSSLKQLAILALGKAEALEQQMAGGLQLDPGDVKILTPHAAKVYQRMVGTDPSIGYNVDDQGEVKPDQPAPSATAQPQAGKIKADSAVPPIIQRNKSTGAYRHSVDGGKTWKEGKP